VCVCDAAWTLGARERKRAMVGDMLPPRVAKRKVVEIQFLWVNKIGGDKLENLAEGRVVIRRRGHVYAVE
jgi:hypothetical protein